MNKNIYLNKLITSGIAAAFLASVLFRAEDPITKGALLPFLLAGIFSAAKNLCLMGNKEKAAQIFGKLFQCSFFLLWFGFLMVWCYLTVKNGSYASLIITVPFWLAGIFAVKRILFPAKRSSKRQKARKAGRDSSLMPVIVGGGLVVIVLVSGVWMLYLGIRDTYTEGKQTKNYRETIGSFVDYSVYHTYEDGTTYRLTYAYTVDGQEYAVTTDYGTNYVPQYGSTRAVKYDPKDPGQAVLKGSSGNTMLIGMGAFFLLGGSVFVLAALHIKGCFDKTKIDVMGTYVGAVLFIVGIGIILFQNGTTGSFSETVGSMGLWILIPVLFVAAGVFQIVKCTYFRLLDRNIS